MSLVTVVSHWQDAHARPLRDLRISLTDRCNFRCSYCMPKARFGPEHVYLPSSDLLTFPEIVRLARLLVAQGVDKIRLTGGEPLLRKGIEDLIAELAALCTPNGQTVDLALTTNGSLLSSKAHALRQAGLQRITVSLDAVDDAVFRRMNDVDFPVQTVLDGIAQAQAVGLNPVKVNMVVKAGSNDDQILPMVRYFRGSGVALRFIEYMDVGRTNGWQAQHVLPNAEVLALIQREFPLRPLNTQRLGETANRWAYADGAGQLAAVNGEVGFISSVSQAFCADCTRLRLSADGRLFLCLFAYQGHDVRTHLRNNISDEALTTVLAQLWQQRNDRYSALRGMAVPLVRMEMNYMGG